MIKHTLADTRAKAQRSANADREPKAILNLNPYSPLYVIRDVDARMVPGERDCVAIIQPE